MHDLMKNTSMLLTIIGVILTVMAIIVLVKLNNIKEKVDLYSSMHNKCREKMIANYLIDSEYDEYKQNNKEKDDIKKIAINSIEKNKV
jgi:hypothetical protein